MAKSVQGLIAEFLSNNPNADNDEVAAYVRKRVPGAKTSAASVSSIKSRMKREGTDEDSLPWVGEYADQEPEPTETVEEATRRITLRYKAMERMSAKAVEGTITSLIISGPPGLGKSWTVRNAIKEAGLTDKELAPESGDYVYIGGAISATGLYKALYQCAEEGKLLVLDDCDDVFRDETSLNLLKIALDSNEERVISWRKEAYWLENAGVPDRFQFDGTVVFLTNLDFEAIIQSGRRDAEHFKALIDRSMYLCLTLRSRRDFMIRINQVCGGEDGMLRKHFKLSARQCTELLEFVELNKEKFYNLSLRLCGQIAICMKADAEGWRDDVEATKMRTI